MRGEIITRDEMLKIPANEISDTSQIPSEPLVSVIVITYNHERYIEETIQGILAQQCDFPIELIIGEDKSQDRTLEICLDYQQRYPHLIRVLTWLENVGPNANFLRCWGRAQGKYVAICEGDDYWIDPTKLSKQVAIMEASPKTMLCGAKVRTINGVYGPVEMKCQYGIEDVIEEQLFHTSTYFCRTAGFMMPACALSVYCLDRIMMAAAAVKGSIKCLPETVSVYRIHAGGIYAGKDNTLQYEEAIAALRAISTFVVERNFSRIRKRAEILQADFCHKLAFNGRLTEARRVAWELVWSLARYAPKRTLVLIFHISLPRTFRLILQAWTRHKHRGASDSVESQL